MLRADVCSRITWFTAKNHHKTIKRNLMKGKVRDPACREHNRSRLDCKAAGCVFDKDLLWCITTNENITMMQEFEKANAQASQHPSIAQEISSGNS